MYLEHRVGTLQRLHLIIGSALNSRNGLTHWELIKLLYGSILRSMDHNGLEINYYLEYIDYHLFHGPKINFEF